MNEEQIEGKEVIRYCVNTLLYINKESDSLEGKRKMILGGDMGNTFLICFTGTNEEFEKIHNFLKNGDELK